jgi:hypothetical protein
LDLITQRRREAASTCCSSTHPLGSPATSNGHETPASKSIGITNLQDGKKKRKGASERSKSCGLYRYLAPNLVLGSDEVGGHGAEEALVRGAEYAVLGLRDDELRPAPPPAAPRHRQLPVLPALPLLKPHRKTKRCYRRERI